MNKKIYLFGYLGLILGAVSLQSCNGDPIDPYTGGSGNGIDTTWVSDSTDNNGGNPVDSTSGNGGGTDPYDSTGWNGSGTDPYDSTGWNGGSNDPNDSTGWNPFDSTGFGG